MTTWPCCRCCDLTYLGGQRTCAADDKHTTRCVMCGQGSAASEPEQGNNE